MSLGTKLYELRNKAGLSQDALAEKLDVSRQSVSKWETDVSVPELEKLVRLSELFHVTLDELVLDRPGPAAPENTQAGASQAEAAPPAPESRADAGRPLTGARLAGAILLIIAGVGTLLGTLLGLFLAGFGILLLTVPLCVPGILCLACKKRPALWAVWSAVLMAEIYLASATGVSPAGIVFYLWHPELLAGTSPAAFWVSGALLAVDVLMILWTVLSFRRTVLPRNAKTVILAVGLWLLAMVILPAASRLVIEHLPDPSTVTTAPDWHRINVIVDLVNLLLGVPRLPLLAAAVTVTVLLLKKRKAQA